MAKVLYTQQIASKKFRGATTKEAYMDACRWYATNIISKDKLHDIQVEYQKQKDGSIKMILYAVMEHQPVFNQHCACCREMHHSFFINEDTACNRCSVAGFDRRLESKMQIKVSYYKELLSKMIKEGQF